MRPWIYAFAPTSTPRFGEILKVTKGLRGGWFAMAFVSIGQESKFRLLAA